MDPLSLTVSIATLIGTTSQIVGYLNDVKDAPKERAKLASEAACLYPLLIQLKYRVDEAKAGDMWYESTRTLLGGPSGPLAQFGNALAELAGKLMPAAGLKSFGRKLIWTLDKKECVDTLAKIERLKTLMGLALQEDAFTLARDIKSDTAGIPDLSRKVADVTEGVEELQVTKNDQLHREVVGWLSPLNFLKTQIDVFSRRQTGTGQWLIESTEFKDWVSGSGVSLWCPGIPGAGKTVLASIVVDQLREQFKEKNDVGIACMYCNYKEKDVQTLVNLIGSLWMQLIQNRAVISKSAEDLYKNHAGKGTSPTLDEVLKLLQSEFSRYSKIFVVIDALDELPAGEQLQKILLTHLQALQPPVNLMVTSRFIDSIERQFRGVPNLEISASPEDLETYVINRISQSNRLSRHVSNDTALNEEIVKNVVGKAKKMFLLSRLHMDSLATKGTRKAVREALKALPKELEKTYQEAMQRIKSQNDDDRQLAERVLLWISFAFRPLTLIELQHALAVELGEPRLDEENIPDEELLTSLCAGLVIVDKQINVIRLVHYTTQEYFERIRADEFPNAQAEIAKTCLTYLSFDVFADGPCSSTEELETRQQQNPLLQYAAMNGGNHARLSPERVIRDEIQELFGHEGKVSCFAEVLYRDLYFSLPSDGLSKAFPKLCVAAYFALTETIEIMLEEGTDIEVYDLGEATALQIAASRGHEEVVKLLLEKGADIESKDFFEQTSLYKAASQGHEGVVKLLLKKGANIEAKDGGEQTALHTIAFRGYEVIAKLLLKEGANIEAKDNYEETVLHKVADKGHEEIVKLLLEKGADIEAKNCFQRTALFNAALRGHEVVVKLLLEKGASIEAKSDSEETVLHTVASVGHEAVLKLLLEKGANIKAEDEYKETALHKAASQEHEVVVKLLLEKGADIRAKNDDGETALHNAASREDGAIVGLLLEKGADIEAKDKRGAVALHKAASRGYETVVKLLLEKGADIEAEDEEGETALHTAALANQNIVVELLLEMGANIEAKEKHGETALHVATSGWNKEVVKLLLEKGADIEAKDKEVKTALHKAASRGYETVVKLLLEKGADIEAKDEEGETALHRAAFGGHEAVVKLLLERGADIEAKDEYGETALHKAASQSHNVVVELLLERGADIEAKEKHGETALQVATSRWNEEVVKSLSEKEAEHDDTDDDTYDDRYDDRETALHFERHEAVVKLLSGKGAES